MNRICIGCLLLSLASICLITYHMASARQSQSTTIRRIVNDELDKRENALVAKYRPRLQEVQKEFGVKPTDPQSIENLIDAIIDLGEGVRESN